MGDVEIRFLEDIGGIHPAQEAAVQPEADHPPEPLAMADEERRERLDIGRWGRVGLLAGLLAVRSSW